MNIINSEAQMRLKQRQAEKERSASFLYGSMKPFSTLSRKPVMTGEVLEMIPKHKHYYRHNLSPK